MSMIAEMRQGWGAITGRSAAGPSPWRWWLRDRLASHAALACGVGGSVLMAMAAAVWSAIGRS